MGEVGAGPTTPEETDLQSAAFADSLLSQINWHAVKDLNPRRRRSVAYRTIQTMLTAYMVSLVLAASLYRSQDSHSVLVYLGKQLPSPRQSR